MIVNLTPSCYNGCDSKRGLNAEAKTLNELRDESLKGTGSGPSASVTGRDSRGVEGGEPGDGGLDPRGSGENEGILSNERGAVRNPYARETGTNKATKDHSQKRVLSLGVRLRFSF